MIKKNIYFLIISILFLINFVSGFDVEKTTLKIDALNYSVYLNSTISVDRLFINDNSIRLYNLSSGGIFTNINDTYNSVISFYNITSPINDLIWDNLTVEYNLTTINITLPALRYFQIVDNETITPPITPPGGGGGPSATTNVSDNVTDKEEVICSNVYDFIIDNYEYGVINYTTEQLVNLTNYINDELDSDLMPDTISEYVVNYQIKCRNYKELPASIQFGLAVASLKGISNSDIWESYRYDIIFFSIIGTGVFGFEYFKRNKKKKKKDDKKT